jgi:hypothetical protein
MYRNYHIAVLVKSIHTFRDTELVMIPEQIPAQDYTGNVSVQITGARCDYNMSCTYLFAKNKIACQSEGVWAECSINRRSYNGCFYVDYSVEKV